MKASEAKNLSDDINNKANKAQLQRVLAAIETAAKNGKYSISTGYYEISQAVVIHLASLGYEVTRKSSNDQREDSYMLISWE